MKTVFEPGMVAHVWAAQSQATGKTSHGNFYFSGASLYSYGSHYLCGLIMADGVALLNANKHSVTTSRHQGYAEGAVSHRTRYHVPDLTKLGVYLRDLENYKKKSGEYNAAAERVRKYVADCILTLSDGAAEYLLSHIGVKNALRVAVKMREAKRRADEKEKQKEAADTKKDRLTYASRVSKLVKSEKDLVAGLANVMADPGKLARNATLLHNAHRAAKAAKRDKQAADVWRVLQLVRAEIKRRADCEARKNANQWQRNQIGEFRAGLVKLKNAFNGSLIFAGASRDYGDYDAAQLLKAANNVLEFPSVKRAKPALASLVSGLTPCIEEMERTREAREAAQAARELSDWRSGVPGSRVGYRAYGSAALLRARNVTRDNSGTITGGTLETSQGASVPLVHAVRAFRFLKLVRERGEGWNANGHSLRVGHFRVDSIAPNGDFRAGCHRIEWQEVETLAQSLGVFDTAASDDALEITASAA